MTVSTITSLDEWAAHPHGQAARIALAVLGLASAVLVLLVATLQRQALGSSYFLVWHEPPRSRA